MKLCLMTAVFFTFTFAAVAQNDSSFKIVGYYSFKSAIKEDLKTFPFQKLTHVNLYFINPDTFGNYSKNLTQLVPFIQAAHKNNVKVLCSIGGGGRHAYYVKLLNDEHRSKFINQLISLTTKYNFDGVDVDLEDKDIDTHYDSFVTSLAAELHQRSKLITAAVAIYFKESYSDHALSQFDFINLMSYDHTGPWAPQNPGPHSTYSQAISDLSYFRNERRIPKNKITLGVPFYGYGFGPAHATRGIDMNYAHIVKDYPGAEFKDEVMSKDSTIIYYNGISTITLKTALAKSNASGVMIWQLSADAPAPYSLLDAIFISQK